MVQMFGFVGVFLSISLYSKIQFGCFFLVSA